MSKSDPDADWDEIKGFDGVKGEYVRLNTDSWLKVHRIRERARELGKQELPSPDLKVPDEIHHKMQSWINHRARQCKQDVDLYLGDQLALLNRIEEPDDIETLKMESDRIVSSSENELRVGSDEDRDALNHIKTDLLNSWRDWLKFRKDNNRLEPAQSSDQFVAVIWVLVLFSIETILNASLLMEVNPFGLIGAVLQMGLITAVNVLFGFLGAGQTFRYVNHVSLVKRFVFGWLFTGTITAVIVCFNVAVGHFRDSMQAIAVRAEADPLAALGDDVIPRLSSEPLGFDSFQTLLLVIIGMIFFSIAWWKGYGWDDPYPGHGRRTRKLNSMQRRYESKRKTAVQAAMMRQKEAIKQLQDIQHKVTLKNNQWNELVEAGGRVARNYVTHLRQYQDDLNYLIAAYRDENRQSRSTPDPSFFTEPILVDPMILEPPQFIPPDRTNPQSLMEHIHEKIIQIHTIYSDEEITRIYPTLDDLEIEAKGVSDGV